MKFSIITVTYNSAPTLEHTIRSVASQDYPGKEHIIIDGGSTDGTLAITGRHKALLGKVVSEKDNGLYDALNKGISLAEGNAIVILHSDDFFADEKVLSRYAEIFERTGCDAVYADLQYVDRNNVEKIKRKWKSNYIVYMN